MMEVVEEHKSPYTILRIKRKRDEEAPDVLVVEPSPKGTKRRKSGMGVFEKAETMDASAWKDDKARELLRNRITAQARHSLSPSRRSIEHVPATDAMSRASSQACTSRQYRVISQTPPTVVNPQSTFDRVPCIPKVYTSKELAAAQAAGTSLKIYDAELTSARPEELDTEMAKFQALLRDYLTVNDGPSEQSPSTLGKSPDVSSTARSMTPSTSDDFVYDIFVHRPSVHPEWAEAVNIATLTGLPAAFDDEYDSDSETEEEDEADEDSNAEDFYKNDYPDETDDDSGSSDMFHEDSEDDDGFSHAWRD